MRKLLALCCAVWIAFLPEMALAQSAATTGDDGSPTKSTGVRILGSDGTNDYKINLDSGGRLGVQAAYPGMEVLNHLSNRTIAAAGIDSSGVPIYVGGYRQMYGLLRIKAATFGANNCLKIAFRANVNAQTDSTAAGWWAQMGVGYEHGRTIYLVNPPSSTNGAYQDRYWNIPITDSLLQTPIVAPYGSFFVRNLTGAQVIYDLWILGVR